MISIFKRETKVKHIKLFESKIAELIIQELPQIKKSIEEVKMNIYFSKVDIQIMRTYYPKTYNEIKKNFNFFELSGIHITEKKTKEEVEIKLYYQNDCLDKIKVDRPQTFYKDFDFNSLVKKDLAVRNIKTENPDLELVSKILSSLTKQQLEQLDVDATFEIEIEEKFYYPILDFENGNYIAVDKKGKIYRLIHDDKEIVKQIFKNPNDFMEAYSGNKSDLEIYFE